MDTRVAVFVAEDTNREEGWQYTGALLYDLKVPKPGPRQRVQLIGKRTGDSRVMDVTAPMTGCTYS